MVRMEFLSFDGDVVTYKYFLESSMELGIVSFTVRMGFPDNKSMLVLTMKAPEAVLFDCSVWERFYFLWALKLGIFFDFSLNLN